MIGGMNVKTPRDLSRYKEVDLLALWNLQRILQCCWWPNLMQECCVAGRFYDVNDCKSLPALSKFLDMSRRTTHGLLVSTTDQMRSPGGMRPMPTLLIISIGSPGSLLTWKIFVTFFFYFIKEDLNSNYIYCYNFKHAKRTLLLVYARGRLYLSSYFLLRNPPDSAHLCGPRFWNLFLTPVHTLSPGSLHG